MAAGPELAALVGAGPGGWVAGGVVLLTSLFTSLFGDSKKELEKFKREEEARNQQKIKDLQKEWESKLNNASATQRAEYTKKMKKLEKEAKKERDQLLAQLNDLQTAVEDAQNRAALLKEQLEKPLHERLNKIRFINALRLPVRQTNKLAVVGTKGTGKSTFLWLMGEGPPPKKALADGTLITTAPPDSSFVDTVGLMGTDLVNLTKWLILLLYQGIPKDVILFTNDRAVVPISNMAHAGITFPMLVTMHSTSMWTHFNKALNPGARGALFQFTPKKIGRRTVQWVQSKIPDDDPLEYIYGLDTYLEFQKLYLGTPLTHHLDLDAIVREREHHSVSPFKNFLELIGGVGILKIREVDSRDMDPRQELFWRLLHKYEIRYKNQPNGEVNFMNDSALDF